MNAAHVSADVGARVCVVGAVDALEALPIRLVVNHAVTLHQVLGGESLSAQIAQDVLLLQTCKQLK